MIYTTVVPSEGGVGVGIIVLGNAHMSFLFVVFLAGKYPSDKNP